MLTCLFGADGIPRVECGANCCLKGYKFEGAGQFCRGELMEVSVLDTVWTCRAWLCLDELKE